MLNHRSFLNRSRWNAKVRFRVDDGDDALVDRAGTLLLPMRRERLLRYLPSCARIAEIGVARGRFSAQLKATCQPAFLALIDPWCQQDQAVYYSDGNNAAQDDQDQRFKSVTRRFASSTPGRECRVIRKFSADAVKVFEDKSLDWVFIDGNHSHEACLEDLRLWAPKVKDDGLLCGHDFAAHATARRLKFGVVEAVRDFVTETGFELAALTVEHFPTYVIAKMPKGETLARMRRLLFTYEPHVTQVAGVTSASFEHARILDNGIPRSGFICFSFPKAERSSVSAQHAAYSD
jgi:Methyltransferase domain